MAIREGLWDCESCGHKGLRGRELSCPKCGYRRPEGVKFYLPEDAAEITDEELIKRAKAGADWVCEWCGASSSAVSTACAQCGAERGSSPAQKIREYDAANVPRTGDATIEKPTPPPPPTSGKFALSPLLIGIIIAVLLICGVSGFFLLRTKETTATITGFSWERSIDIERFTTVTEEGKRVPSDGRIVGERDVEVEETVQTGTRTYVCGQVDLGNGMFEDKECEEPVYETRYRTETIYIYEVDRWVHDRTERASGTDRQPYWPRSDLDDDERESDEQERYSIHAVDTTNEKDYEVKLDEETWMLYEEGEEVLLKVNVLGFAEIVEQ
jgi:ribosomal protein L37E